MERNLANYMDGWVAIGSWLLCDYGFADRVAQRLGSQQDEATGGILTGPRKWAGRRRYDLATAASCGRAFLLTGRREAALRAAGFLVGALEHQTDRATGLDLCFDSKWNPLDAPDPSERTYYRLEVENRGEKVWFPAFGCAFLCEAHQVSGREVYLKAAREYFKVISRTPEFRARTLANGKSGWCAGLLALATGEPQYFDAVRWLVPNVLGRQSEEGDFGAAPRSRSRRPAGRTGEPLPRRFERTAEFTTWSAHYLRMYTLGLWEESGGVYDG